MTDTDIDKIFRTLFTRFGREEVERRLALLVEHADALSAKGPKGGPRSGAPKPKSRPKAKPKPKNALEEVEAMQVPEPRKDKLRELAKRFESKSFLPAVGDIRNLLYTYGADTSSIKTRQASVAKVFFFLSTLSEERLGSILNDFSFSGPSRLAPLSDAIKSRGSSRRQTDESPKSHVGDEKEEPGSTQK